MDIVRQQVENCLRYLAEHDTSLTGADALLCNQLAEHDSLSAAQTLFCARLARRYQQELEAAGLVVPEEAAIDAAIEEELLVAFGLTLPNGNEPLEGTPALPTPSSPAHQSRTVRRRPQDGLRKDGGRDQRVKGSAPRQRLDVKLDHEVAAFLRTLKAENQRAAKEPGYSGFLEELVVNIGNKLLLFLPIMLRFPSHFPGIWQGRTPQNQQSNLQKSSSLFPIFTVSKQTEIIKVDEVPTGRATRVNSAVNWLEGTLSSPPVFIRQRYFCFPGEQKTGALSGPVKTP